MGPDYNSTLMNEDDEIKLELLGVWFMSPINNTSMKIRKECEPLIGSKISQFASSNGFYVYDITEVVLVQSANSNYIASSVDRLALYDEIQTNGIKNTYIIGIEIKCMTAKKQEMRQ